MASRSRRRGRVLIYVALILILALVVVYALVIRGGGQPALVGQTEPTALPAEEMVNIVVTSQNVERGIPLTEAQLATIPYPRKDADPSTFYTKVTDLVGKRPKVNLDPRVPITVSMVADETQGSAAAFQIPKGMVAVSIPINRLSSISYAPQPGDHVNVIATMMFVDLDQNFQTVLPNTTGLVVAPGPGANGGNTLTATITGSEVPFGRGETEQALNQPVYVYPSEAQRPRIVSQAVLQDILVLQVGNFPLPGQETAAAVAQPTPTPVAGGGADTQAPAPSTPKAPDSITLVVTPQDAITLNYIIFQRNSLSDATKPGSSGAQLTLALRGSGDDTRVQTEAVTLQYLMDQYNIPVPAKLPYGLEPSVPYLTSPWLEQDGASPQ